SGRKRPIDVLSTPPVTPAKKLKHHVDPPPTEIPASRSSSTSRSGSASSGDALETDVTSPNRESPEPPLPTPTKETTEEERKQVTVSATVDLTPMSLQNILNTPTKEELQPS